MVKLHLPVLNRPQEDEAEKLMLEAMPKNL